MQDEQNTNSLREEQELDDFWDIEKLIPKAAHASKPKKSSLASYPPRTAEPTQPIKAIGLTDAPQKKSPDQVADEVYDPSHPLISRVSLYHWKGGFPFYQRFCETAERLFSYKGSKCDPISFFSYMPQYDQMNRAQMAWYLYWRDLVRHGEYLDTDYSYIFLYLFEIINLPTLVPPQKGQRLMLDIWKRYREDYPVLNRYLADWMCDYSLIHRLLPPKECNAAELRVLAAHSSFKEFYACSGEAGEVSDARMLLQFACNYDYRKSKTYALGKEQSQMLETHIPAALSYALAKLNRENKSLSSTSMKKAVLCRDSFIGALCSNGMKRRIELEYCSFVRSHELRFLITDAVKYSENKIRASLGVKSRLTVYALPQELREALDEYFSSRLPSGRSIVKQESVRPAYEALYDLPPTQVSVEKAAEIEQSSWHLTQRLVDAFTLPQEPEQPAPVLQELVNEEENTDISLALAPFKVFLKAVLDGNVADQKNAARDLGLLPDAVVERINTLAFDCIGDVLVETEDSGAYRLIEDYIDTIDCLFH